jgi:hypothetical protein
VRFIIAVHAETYAADPALFAERDHALEHAPFGETGGDLVKLRRSAGDNVVRIVHAQSAQGTRTVRCNGRAQPLDRLLERRARAHGRHVARDDAFAQRRRGRIDIEAALDGGQTVRLAKQAPCFRKNERGWHFRIQKMLRQGRERGAQAFLTGALAVQRRRVKLANAALHGQRDGAVCALLAASRDGCGDLFGAFSQIREGRKPCRAHDELRGYQRARHQPQLRRH